MNPIAIYGNQSAFNIRIFAIGGGGYYAVIYDGSNPIWQRRNNAGGFDVRVFVSTFDQWFVDKFTTFSYNTLTKTVTLSGVSDTFHGVTVTRSESYRFVGPYIIEDSLVISADIDGASIQFSNVSYPPSTPDKIWDIDNANFGYNNSDNPFGVGMQLTAGGSVYGQIADHKYNLGGNNLQKRANANIGGQIAIGCIWIPRSDVGTYALTNSVNGRMVTLTQWFYKSTNTLYDFNLQGQLAVAAAKKFKGTTFDKLCQVTVYLNQIRQNDSTTYMMVPSHNYQNGSFSRDSFWQSFLMTDAQEQNIITQFETVGQDPTTGQMPDRISNTNTVSYPTDESTLFYMIRAFYDKTCRNLTVNATALTKALTYIKSVVTSDQFRIDGTNSGHTKMWNDGFIFTSGTYCAYNQGLYCVALKCAQRLGLSVTNADITNAIAQYQALYDGALGFVKFASNKSFIAPDVLVGEALSLFLFGEKMLSDTAVNNTILQIATTAMTTYGAMCIANSDGSFLATSNFATGNEQGYYQNGASWFLYEYLAYFAGQGHGYSGIQDLMDARIDKELLVDPFLKEFCLTKVGTLTVLGTEQTIRHGYSWNAVAFIIQNFSYSTRQNSKLP